MLTKPVGQLGPIDPAGGDVEHETLLFIDPSVDLVAVEDEKRLHGGVAEALVAVDDSIRGHVLVVAHTERNDTVRIISARRATRREREFYEQGKSTQR